MARLSLMLLAAICNPGYGVLLEQSLKKVYEVYVKASEINDAVSQGGDYYGYYKCISAANLASGQPWCETLQNISTHWENCENFFQFLDSYGACHQAMQCGLHQVSVYGPVAGECLSNCDEDGCEDSLMSTVLANEDICGDALPYEVRYNLVDLPFGPVVMVSFAYLYSILMPHIEMGKDIPLGDKCPIFDYINWNVQALLLLQVLYRTISIARGVHPSCGWLLLNTLPLFSPATICISTIATAISTWSSVSFTIEYKRDRFYKIFKAACVLPMLSCLLFVVVQFGITLAILVTGIWGLLPFTHIAVLQIIITIVPLIVMYMAFFFANSYYRRNFTSDGDDYQDGPDPRETNDWQLAALFKPESARMFFMICLACVQITQALCVLGWAFYMGMSYSELHEAYFKQWQVLPLQWPSVNLKFYLNIDIFLRVFTFDLDTLAMLVIACVFALGLTVLSLAFRFLTRCSRRCRTQRPADVTAESACAGQA